MGCGPYHIHFKFENNLFEYQYFNAKNKEYFIGKY